MFFSELCQNLLKIIGIRVYKTISRIQTFCLFIHRSNEEIIQLIKDGEHDDIGSEKLRGLLKILPEIDELDMLKAFDGDKVRLGNAEKFLMQLSQVPK